MTFWEIVLFIVTFLWLNKVSLKQLYIEKRCRDIEKLYRLLQITTKNLSSYIDEIEEFKSDTMEKK